MEILIKVTTDRGRHALERAWSDTNLMHRAIFRAAGFRLRKTDGGLRILCDSPVSLLCARGFAEKVMFENQATKSDYVLVVN